MRRLQNHQFFFITEQLFCNHTTPEKDKEGNIITTEREQAERWMQHFQEVLNRPDPDELADPPPSEVYLDRDTRPPRIQQKSTQQLKARRTEKLQESTCLQADHLTTSAGWSSILDLGKIFKYKLTETRNLAQ